MVIPNGIGSGNGSGLAGFVIMATDRIWLICVALPLPLGRAWPPSLDGTPDCVAGLGVPLACCPAAAVLLEVGMLA